MSSVHRPAPVHSPDSRFADLRRALDAHARAHGIDVRDAELPMQMPAAFDGLSITLNPRHDAASLCWYLAHSFGSIAGWSLDLDPVAAMFHALRAARDARPRDEVQHEQLIARFRAFEERSSSYSVWTLARLGHDWAVRPFTLFFRADLEGMTIFHRHGRAPVWRSYLAEWELAVANGSRALEPFPPVPVPPFTPLRFERQEVTQTLG